MTLTLKPNDSRTRFSNVVPPKNLDCLDLIEWSIGQFADLNVVLTTAFGMEGCALIDMYSRVATSLKIAYIDTGFFFPETKKLIEKMESRYPNFEFVKWVSPISIQQQADEYGDNLWKNQPDLCCKIRKVAPMAQNLKGNDIWVSAIRNSQTKQRSGAKVFSWNAQYGIAKFCPLLNWTREQVWDYVQLYDVPFNQLHLQGFPSIGCFHCTKSVPGSSPQDDTRSGRWEGHQKTECGLHY